jgi:hypothetical protein
MVTSGVGLLVAGCATATPAWTTWVSADRTVAVAFPVPPRERQGHEGPRVRSTVARASDAEGRVYELALFTIARVLSPAEQADLSDRVLQGLAARPDGRSFDATPLSDAVGPVHRVVIELEGDRRGYWRIFYSDARTMVQLSVVGPDDEALGGLTTEFFDSFQLTPSVR